MINGVWYGFEESATNKPDPTITYGAVRCVKWSNNNADIEVISMMNPAIRYINHYVDITGWEGWKKVSTYTGTNDPTTQLSSLTSQINTINSTLSNIIVGRAFEFTFNMKTGHNNYEFSVPAYDSDESGTSTYIPIALKTLSISFGGSNSGNFHINGWAIGVETSFDLWINIYNSSSSNTSVLSCILIYAKRSVLGSLVS